MSFWLRRRDKQGRVYWYSVSVLTLFAFFVIALLGLILALILPILHWLRGLL
jgi:hypothetical protein